MIIFRYLTREVLVSMSAVTGVLLLIIMSGRFIKYLTNAAEGQLSVDILLLLISYRIPGFLELILPLGLFLGILLSYGRLYLDNEITTLSACGISDKRLQWMTLGPGLMVAVLVACLSFWVTPWGAGQVKNMLNQQESMTEFDVLVEGRFQKLPTKGRVSYVGELTNNRTELLDIFLSEQIKTRNGNQLGIVVAESGRQYRDQNTGSRFLLLKNGYRYEGVPGQADFRMISFEEYGVRLQESQVREQVTEVEVLPTIELWRNEGYKYRAQLHWRVSLPILCIMVVLLAVPLSKVSPRQGRYSRLLPSILIYLTYLTLLASARSGMDEGEPGAVLRFWSVHLLFAFLAFNLHFTGRFWRRLLSLGWLWLPIPGRSVK
ncbi:MAG: lipopolysaccharide export system permease protein [Motiliproteus sp.]